MRLSSRTVGILTAAAVVCGTACPAPAADFEQSFAAVVLKNCVACHNPGESRGGLDLTHKDGVSKGGKSGPVIVPGKPEDSYLIQRITEGSMPPKNKGSRLTAEEVALLSGWVKAGAAWPDGRVLSPFELTTDRRAGYDW